MVDVYQEVGAALVVNFLATVTPTGEEALALVTDDPPDQLGSTPALVIFQPTEDDIQWRPGKQVDSIQHWPVRFFRTPGPKLAERTIALAKWRMAFLPVVVNRIQLGLTYVDWAQLKSINPTDGLYAEQVLDMLDMVVDVKIRTVISTASA